MFAAKLVLEGSEAIPSRDDHQEAQPAQWESPKSSSRSRALRRRRGAKMADLAKVFRKETSLTKGSAEADLLEMLSDIEILSPDVEESLVRRWIKGGREEDREAFLMSMIGRLMRMCMREDNIGEDYLDILNDAVTVLLSRSENLTEFDRSTFRTGVMMAVHGARNNLRLRMTRQVSGPRALGPRRAIASIMRFDFESTLRGETDAYEIARPGQRIPGPIDDIEQMLEFLTTEDIHDADVPQESHEDSVIHAVDAALLPTALDEALDARAADIMRRRWLSDVREGATEIGMDWNITPERVRQIERQSLRDLRALFEGGRTEKMIRDARAHAMLARRRDQALARRTSPHGKVGGIDLTAARPRMRGLLSVQEHEVMSWRYFSGSKVMSFEELAEIMEIESAARAAEIERSALMKLALIFAQSMPLPLAATD